MDFEKIDKSDLKSVLLIAVAILALAPLFFYLYKFGSFTLSNDKSDWGTFGDYIGGIVNTFIGILTLIVTGYIAFTFNEYEKRRDAQLKNAEDVKSYLELYQYFTGPEFREKRQIAWNVIRKAVENEGYKKFLIQETFVSRYINRIERDDVYKDFKYYLFPGQPLNREDFLHRESEDRHKLDGVINFFQLLAIKDVPKDYYAICDFYYDSWRPLLCWYAREIEIGYRQNEQNKKFNNPPSLRAAIALLDQKFYNPEIPNTLTIDNVDEHPILNWYINGKKKDKI